MPPKVARSDEVVEPQITGLPPHERVFGTAATIALAVAAGADMVRIHDVEALMSAVDVADAICRVGSARSVRSPEPRTAPRVWGRFASAGCVSGVATA